MLVFVAVSAYACRKRSPQECCFDLFYVCLHTTNLPIPKANSEYRIELYALVFRHSFLFFYFYRVDCFEGIVFFVIGSMQEIPDKQKCHDMFVCIFIHMYVCLYECYISICTSYKHS